MEFGAHVFQNPHVSGILPNTDFAQLVHLFTWHPAQYIEQDVRTRLAHLPDVPRSIDFQEFWAVSPFHWQMAAELLSLLPHENLNDLAEAHWNAALAEIIATGILNRNSAHLHALKQLEHLSERAQHISSFNYCLLHPTIESFSECLLRRDVTPIERLVLTYGEAYCYAARKDEERFEHTAKIFATLCITNTEKEPLPSVGAAAYQLIRTLRQFDKSQSDAIPELKTYIHGLRSSASPFVRVHTEILCQEDVLNFDFWGGNVHQKIDWTLQALETLQFAQSFHVPAQWYSYLQYITAQRCSYSGVYDIAKDMITDLERHSPIYALVARGYLQAEREQYPKAVQAYQELITKVEEENAAAMRSETHKPPTIRQSDMAFCYYYAAQALFNIRSNEDEDSQCADFIEKFFLWSEYLSLSARQILHEICRAMQNELLGDLPTAVEHYERYQELLSNDDYISKIKTLSHLAQIYADELQNFAKADENVQLLKSLLPIIQQNSTMPLSGIDDSTPESTSTQLEERTTTVQLWLTKYSLKATQKVLSTLDSVTNQLAGAYQLVEQQNNKLVQVNASLVELNNEKNEFLGIVAHDLKSPLSAIVLSIDLLEKYRDRMNEEQQLKKLQDVRHTAQRMNNIVTNLLDINAIETGKFNFSPTLFNFSEAVHKTVEDYQERATVKNITLNFETNNEEANAFADSTASIEILDNLISNAVKYSPHNKNVFVRVEQLSESVRCYVKDEGPGLSETDKEKLFGKFARLSAKPTGGEHSTGLGLSIVKKLALAMNGNVWCESELGKGATFVIQLPNVNV